MEAAAREDAARAEATIARLRAEAAELSGGAKSRTGQLAAEVARLEGELRAACKRAAVRGGEGRGGGTAWLVARSSCLHVPRLLLPPHWQDFEVAVGLSEVEQAKARAERDRAVAARADLAEEAERYRRQHGEGRGGGRDGSRIASPMTKLRMLYVLPFFPYPCRGQ